MTDAELEKSLNATCEQTVGRQREVEELTQSLLKRGKKTSSVLLTGPPGVGKTAIMKQLADQIAAQGLTDRLKDFVIFTPYTPEQVRDIVGKMIDLDGKVPADRKEEAKTLMHEVIAQEEYDSAKGLRGLRPIIKAIAEVSSAPDMREALAGRYPMFINRVSIRTGERLADEFTNGTATRAGVRKPVKFKSREKSRGVGFFTLN